MIGDVATCYDGSLLCSIQEAVIAILQRICFLKRLGNIVLIIYKEKMPKGKQFSDQERRNLQELVLKYSDIVENKATDAVSLQQKKSAWGKIVMAYNANSENSQVNITI